MKKLLLALLFIAMSISPGQTYAESFTGTAPLPVNITLDVEHANDTGYITAYEWDINGDGVFEINTGRRNHINYIFPTGLHIVGMKVTDNYGNSAFGNHSVIALKPVKPTISIYVDTCSVCSTNGTQ